MSDIRFITGAAAFVCTAALAFGQQCDVTPPAGAIQNNDVGYCGNLDVLADPNGGCNEDPIAYQNLGTLGSGETISVYGTVGAWDQGTDPQTGEPIGVRDLDWYTLNVSGGPGTLRYRVRATNDTLAADPDDFLFFVLNPATGDCSGNVYEGYLPSCDDFWSGPADDATTYGFVVTVNGFGSTSSDCTTSYVIEIWFEGATYDCGDPAQGSCIENNGSPGCDDAVCCEIVCEYDSVCCEDQWDSYCADLAKVQCGYFIYECDDPVAANDCVGEAIFESIPADGTIALSFDTTGCNTDGPEQPECGSPNDLDQLYSDVWYVATPAADGFLTASTCDGGALWDTKIAAYNYDAATFDPAMLPDYIIDCNEDCGDAAFASEVSFEVTGGISYLIRVGGYNGDSGPGTLTLSHASYPVYECDLPASYETHTQNSTFDVLTGGISCQGGGITTVNQYARKFLDRPAEKIGCVDFAVSNGGSSQIASLRLYADSDPGPVPVLGSFQEIISQDIWIPGGGYQGLVTVSYDPLVDVPAGTNLVVEYDSPASPDGFSSIGINSGPETGETFLRSDACGLADYTPYSGIGYDDIVWVMSYNTWDDDSSVSCEGDLNQDGIVDGPDLTILLAAWGNNDPVADIDGDGTVSGPDLTIVLAAWGECE